MSAICSKQRICRSGGQPASADPSKPAFDFLDLRAQFASIREEVMAAVTRVFRVSILFLVQR